MMLLAQKARSKPRDQMDQPDIGPPQQSHLLVSGNEKEPPSMIRTAQNTSSNAVALRT
jgi:hypothetical protein